MDVKALRALLPRNQDDAEAARAVVALGFPAVEPVLPRLLDWLKTPGSPVEQVMREFFVALGARATPTVRHALRSRHDVLRHAVVARVIAHWPAEAIEPLRTELQTIATDGRLDGSDLAALGILLEHRLADSAWLGEWAQFKSRRLRELLAQAERLESSIDR